MLPYTSSTSILTCAVGAAISVPTSYCILIVELEGFGNGGSSIVPDGLAPCCRRNGVSQTETICTYPQSKMRSVHAEGMSELSSVILKQIGKPFSNVCGSAP